MTLEIARRATGAGPFAFSARRQGMRNSPFRMGFPGALDLL